MNYKINIKKTKEKLSILILLQNGTIQNISSKIELEQNQIIKTFTVAIVCLAPPTLIARIYGMNFKIMPELGWNLGYLF